MCDNCGRERAVSKFPPTQLIMSYPRCTDCIKKLSAATELGLKTGRDADGQMYLPFPPPE